MTLMVYKIPMEDVTSLANSFAQLERGGSAAEGGVTGIYPAPLSTCFSLLTRVSPPPPPPPLCFCSQENFQLRGVQLLAVHLRAGTKCVLSKPQMTSDTRNPPCLIPLPPQVFMEFTKEQEDEEDEHGSQSTTFQWQRLQPESSVSVTHPDSVVNQL